MIGGVAVVAACAALAFVYVGRPSVRQTVSQRNTSPPIPIHTPAYAPVTAERFDRTNVVIITIDTLRRDHLAPYGAPFETKTATRLAREGVVFERAISQVPLTLPSHASIFSGQNPPHHAIRDNGFVLDPSVTTLAERFQSAGYATAGFVSSYVLHSRWGIAQGHEVFDDTFDYRGLDTRSLVDVERPGVAVVDAALTWLRGPKRGSRPFYLWVHLYDPHEPYTPPDAFKRLAPSQYAGEVIYADHEAGRLVDALDSLNLRRNTLIVYLSDHGESLGEYGEPSHGVFLHGATLDVPLIVAPPAKASDLLLSRAMAGRRVHGVSRLVDVAPTVLDLAGLPVLRGVDGTSLLPMIVNETPTAAGRASEMPPDVDGANAIAGPVSYGETYFPRFHYGWSELFSVATMRWRFVRAPRPELYDLIRDPKETRDVSAQYPEVVRTLELQLDALRPSEASAPAPAKLDPEAEARLRSLGYVSGSESAARKQTGPRPDPKDRMPLLQELLQAQSLADAGQLDAAATRLQSLAPRDAENPAVYLALSSVHLRRGDAQAAVDASRRAVALDPESTVSILNLAFAYEAAGRVGDAATGFKRVIELDPGNVKALVGLAETQYRQGSREQALATYQRAAAAAPTFASIYTGLGIVALELNRPDVAGEALKRAVALGDTRESLHFNLGVLAEQRGDPALATREYRTEVEAYPNAFEAWVNLGLLERQRGRIDAALTAFERAAAVKADAFVGPYLLAETLSRAGRIADARRWGQEALRRSPNEPRVQQLTKRLEQQR